MSPIAAEPRAASAVATLFSDARRAEALEVLSPAYTTISGGHDTADLVPRAASKD